MGDGQVTVVVRPGERRAGGWGKRRVNETTNRSWNVSIALLGCRRWSAGIRRNPPEYSPRCWCSPWAPCGLPCARPSLRGPSLPSLRGAGPDCLAELARPGLSCELASFTGTVLRACEHPAWGKTSEPLYYGKWIIFSSGIVSNCKENSRYLTLNLISAASSDKCKIIL